MERAAKSEAVTALGAVFKATKVVVVAHYSGLTVAQMQTLRRQMKQAGASVKVAKNRLARIALEGSDVASIAPLLKGPALIAFSGDPVAAPRSRSISPRRMSVSSFLAARWGPLRSTRMGSRLLRLCPRSTSCGPRLVGLIQAPATKIAQVINAPAAKVARVVQAYASKSGENSGDSAAA